MLTLVVLSVLQCTFRIKPTDKCVRTVRLRCLKTEIKQFIVGLAFWGHHIKSMKHHAFLCPCDRTPVTWVFKNPSHSPSSWNRQKEGIKCFLRHHRGHAGISFFLASTPITMSSELILTFDFWIQWVRCVLLWSIPSIIKLKYLSGRCSAFFWCL